nr:molybdopterin cofactor-binding domain-containing protein [Sphingobium boeckii]
MAAEVEVTERMFNIRRLVCAFDCGRIIDPSSLEAQISGGIVFGLQATLWGEVPFADGRPQVQNFGEFRMPLISDIPPIDVHLVDSDHPPAGAGEASTPLVAPAICNAIAQANGTRIRRLPLSKSFDI